MLPSVSHVGARKTNVRVAVIAALVLGAPLVAGAAGCPSAPRSLVALPAGTQTVDLDWGKPEDDGGSEVRYYVVYRAAEGGAPEAVAYTVGTSFRDADVPEGLWTYTVTAVNAGGESPHSGRALAIAVEA